MIPRPSKPGTGPSAARQKQRQPLRRPPAGRGERTQPPFGATFLCGTTLFIGSGPPALSRPAEAMSAVAPPPSGVGGADATSVGRRFSSRHYFVYWARSARLEPLGRSNVSGCAAPQRGGGRGRNLRWAPL